MWSWTWVNFNWYFLEGHESIFFIFSTEFLGNLFGGKNRRNRKSCSKWECAECTRSSHCASGYYCSGYSCVYQNPQNYDYNNQWNDNKWNTNDNQWDKYNPKNDDFNNNYNYDPYKIPEFKVPDLPSYAKQPEFNFDTFKFD